MILLTESGKIISTKIKELNPFEASDDGVIVKRLLDGSVNVQAIGAIPKKVSFEALIDATEAEDITGAYVKGERLSIQTADKIVSFIITEKPTIERFNRRFKKGKYIAKIKGVEQ